MLREVVRQVQTARNTLKGINEARKWSGRDLVEATEVACFSLFCSHLGQTVPDVTSVANTALAQDFIERQNRSADESRSDSDGVLWQQANFLEEYPRLLTKIDYDMRRKFGDRGPLRTEVIENCFEDWFKTSAASRDRLIKGNLTDPKEYREIDDRFWLVALMSVYADGDIEKVDKVLPQTFAATLLLQLSDDFANTDRHQRTGKLAFLATGENRIEKDDSWPKKIQKLSTEGNDYLSSIHTNILVRQMIKIVWLGRSAFNHLLSSSRTDDKYCDDDLFERSNIFETNLINIKW